MEANYSPPAGPGPFVYRIHDQIYHKIGNLEPEEGVPPSYGQLYIVDAETAARQRAGHAANSGCDSTLMSELADLIARINPYAQSWTMMKEVVNEEWSNSIIEHRDPLKVSLEDLCANVNYYPIRLFLTSKPRKMMFHCCF